MPNANVCNCHDPPGGRVTCEPHQMAVCIVRNGVAQYRCLNPPGLSSIGRFGRSITFRKAVTGPELLRWAVSAVTGARDQTSPFLIPRRVFRHHRSHALGPPPQALLDVLIEGEYERTDGAIVTFSLPESVSTALASARAAAPAEPRYLNG